MSAPLFGMILVILGFIGIASLIAWIVWIAVGYVLIWINAPEEGRFWVQLAATIILVGIGCGSGMRCRS